MTITEELESIILKYKLDNAYPRFKNYVKCKKIVKKLFSEYKENNNILLLSSEQDSLSFALQEIETVCNLEKRVVDVLNFERLNEINFSSYSDIIIVSQEFYREISYELYLRKAKHKCLYDYFVNNGIFIDYNYYNIFGGKFLPAQFKNKKGLVFDAFSYLNPSYELFYNYKKYLNSNEYKSKQFYLQRVIFLSIYLCDFIATDKFINIYNNNKYENFKLYINALKSIEKFLNRIKLKLSARKDDYFVFLNDTLEYGNKKYTPFLNGVSKDSLHFENSYTPSPYTTASFKSLMFSKLVVDDRSFEIPFRKTLIEKLCQDNSIRFKYCGLLDIDTNSHSIVNHHTPASKIYWLAIQDLLQTKQKKFIFMHTLIETHFPNHANNLYNLKHLTCLYGTFYSEWQSQIKLSINYADKQLQYYDKIFPQNSTKIYMSDHGDGFPDVATHTRLSIKAPWIVPKKCTQFFSYLDFYKLCKMLFQKNLESLDSLFVDFIKIQDLPVYDARLKWMLSKFSSYSELFGYRGVISKQGIYIKYGDGYEYYRNFKIGDERISVKRLKYLHSIVGNNYLNYKTERKLAKAKLSFEFLEIYNQKKATYEKKKSKIFLNLLKNFPKEKIIAIHSGGEAGFNLLLKLGIEQQQRISLIIDKNPKCLAAYLGIPVVSPEEAKKSKIDIIITPQNQKNLSQEVQKELLTSSQNSLVIDIYKHLAKKGIVCTKKFWEREFTFNEILKEYRKRNDLYENKKSKIFLNLLKIFPKEKIIAIRSGGEAGFNLLLKLGIEQRQKVSLIIDKNPKCLAANFGILVVSPEKAKKSKIDVIITPQNQENISQEVQKELLAFSKKGLVINIYEHLSKKGIICTNNFWEREFVPENLE
jgi:hypothetical protein